MPPPTVTAPDDPSRRAVLRGIAAASTLVALPSSADPGAMRTRPIPATGEPLPVIGCGTYVGFDVDPADAPAIARLCGVVRSLVGAGGSVLDSSPMYGRAEAATGAVLAETGVADRTFVATKVWTTGRAEGTAQLAASQRLLGKRPLDLVQIHNLVDWKTHLPMLRDAQRAKSIRYVGVSHYTPSAYRELEAVLRAERVDFLQVNYALDEREAERRILPLAAERGVAVLVNRPFGGGGLLRRLRDRPLPAWAPEIGAASWATVLLKFVLSHPAVTCAIPGTGDPAHMADNAAAGSGATAGRDAWTRYLRDVVS